MSTSAEAELASEANVFMLCDALDRRALVDLPPGYHFRRCRPDELDVWMAMPFDDPDDAVRYREFMQAFFRRVYEPRRAEFFERCVFACDASDTPVGTVFVWKVYDAVQSIHWWKVRKDHEGRGIGRALLSYVMAPLVPSDYPVLLHTQPGSFRAIQLYATFGFQLLSNPQVGARRNGLEEALPLLRRDLGDAAFGRLRITSASDALLKALDGETEPHF